MFMNFVRFFKYIIVKINSRNKTRIVISTKVLSYITSVYSRVSSQGLNHALTNGRDNFTVDFKHHRHFIWEYFQ